MLRIRRRRAALLAVHRWSSSLPGPPPLQAPPWGSTTLEALCRRDQSGEALRVVASLGLGVLNDSEQRRRTADVRLPPPMWWHGKESGVVDDAPAVHIGVDLRTGKDTNRWNPERVRRCAAAIQSDLIGHEREATLLLLAALAGEHALIVGPAGVGKSLLAKNLAQLLCKDEARVDGEPALPGAGQAASCSKAVYFERQLSRFSTPEELLGPLSISALKIDQHIRCSEGHLLDPAIRVGFIDEIFRGSTAILNTLLELLASPVDHSTAVAAAARANGQARPCLIAASHPVHPGQIGSDLAPLLDRFLLLIDMQPLPAVRRRELLADHAEATARVSGSRSRRDAGLTMGPAQLADLAERASTVVVPEAVVQMVLGLAQAIEGNLTKAQQSGTGRFGMPAALHMNAQPTDLSEASISERTASHDAEEQFISDRRLVRAIRLLRYAAAADGRKCVDKWDCLLLLHMLPPLDCASSATEAAVDYFRTKMAVRACQCHFCVAILIGHGRTDTFKLQIE